MKPMEKYLAIFLLLTGSAIIVIRAILLIAGKTDDLTINLAGFLCQWLSDIILLVLSFSCALLLLRKKLKIKLVVFLNLGLLLCSTFLALNNYAVVVSEPVISAIILLLFLCGLFFTIKALQQYYVIGMSRGQGKLFNYLFLFSGIMIYYLLNLTGNHLQNGQTGYLITDVFILVNLIYFSIAGLKKAAFTIG
ncbi:MAG: hypothetical protein JXR46_12075 [Calditrichaceae bacterium]|nr:hypothetical protein [Calditrichaceae bacterium]MBN2709773.1 hypothetical protein [Calditrichaceae bacterium]RQV94967.1 MAG: hypothetical protein EH224_08825 [Calditrichota bacterium]